MAEPPFGHEPSGFDVQRIVAIGAILGGSVILSVLLILWVAHVVIEPAHARSHERVGLLPPPPRLQPHPVLDLAAVRQQEESQLESWGWTDDSREYARIPIERAMVIYLRQQAAVGPRAAAGSRAAAGPGAAASPATADAP